MNQVQVDNQEKSGGEIKQPVPDEAKMKREGVRWVSRVWSVGVVGRDKKAKEMLEYILQYGTSEALSVAFRVTDKIAELEEYLRLKYKLDFKKG